MNPRRPSRFSTRGHGGHGGGGGPRGRRGGTRPPMLLGEPSPGLAKINTMNSAKLQAKIAALEAEHAMLETKLERLRVLDPLPADKIKTIEQLQARLIALRDAAAERLKGKLERKAAREQRGL